MELLSHDVLSNFKKLGYRFYYCEKNQKINLHYEKEDYQFSVTYTEFKENLKKDASFQNVQLLFFKNILF